MNNYVLGFMFDSTHQNVLLIRKNKPEWQAGKLNGIGGKIEPGEQPFDAMVREFHEETGLIVTRDYWTHFGHMTGIAADAGPWNVELFACEGDWTVAENMTDEILHEVPVAQAHLHNIIPNLTTLLAAAEYCLNQHEPHRNFKIHLQYE